MSLNKAQIAKRLISVELKLNDFLFEGVPIGGLLSKHNEVVFRELKPDHHLKLKLSKLKFIMEGFLIKNAIQKSDDAEVLLANISPKKQFSKLIFPLKDHLGSKAILYTNTRDKNEIKEYNFARKVSFKTLSKVQSFLNKNLNKIYKTYLNEGLEVELQFLGNNLFIQLVALFNWLDFLNKHNFNKIIVDFDRDNNNSPLVCAAKSKNIKTISLVHGVINPPYGFYPLLADEMWLWGNYQKELMQNFGLSSDRIKIVGNPIAERIASEKEVENRSKLVYGIAINPIGDKQNIRMLKEVISYSKNRDDINWIIKLHPSMKIESYLSPFKKENVRIVESGEITNQQFFKEIDCLVVGNSGIGYEALLNDVPLFIYVVDDNSKAHDYIMINQGRCPQITKDDTIANLFDSKERIKEYLEEVLINEKKHLKNYYFCVGQEATDRIIAAIQE